MTPSELTAADPKPIIIDLRLSDDYTRGCIPGAHNNCIFEVAFVDRLPGITPELDAPIVVYGADPHSYEAPMALTKMDRLGYTNVAALRGGFQAWGERSLPVIGSNEAVESPEAADGNYKIDCHESVIAWTGRNLLNKHRGTIAITDGHIDVVGNLIIGGEFTIDLNSIDCTDLEGEPRDGLIHHLKSDDFFDVEKYPEATLKIIGSAPVDGNTLGAPNLRISGELSIRDNVVPVRFEVACGISPGGRLAAQGLFSIDRTLWGVIYGSGKFFHRVGMHLVNDLIDIEVKIMTSA